MAKQLGVQVGQQYVKVHSTRKPPPVWEVKSVHPGDFGIAHAGLLNLDDPLDKKTVSFSALLDRTHYRLVSLDQAGVTVRGAQGHQGHGDSSGPAG